jgi:hypothetical protein
MSASFLQWWHRPVRTLDRVAAFFLGAFGGFWIGLLGRLFFGPMPMGIVALGYWGAAGAVLAAVLGIAFPRAVMVVLYPFTFISIVGGGGS